MPRVIFGALMGAITWNVITWRLGIPSSSSHALIGGLLGAGVAKAGVGAIVWTGVIKTGAAIVLSPLIGFLLALAAGAGRLLDCSCARRRSPSTARFGRCSSSRPRCTRSGTAATMPRRPWASSPSCSSRRACSGREFYVPFWVVITCQAAMGLGTLFGGWRIVRTMGSKITRLTPMQGFCAETGGAITLFLATWLGIPVSTTHTITGAIVGVGAARRVSAVRWNVASSIVVAWIVSTPGLGPDRGGLAWPSHLVLMHSAAD